MGLAPIEFIDNGARHVFPLDHGQHCLWTQYHNMRWLLGEIGLISELVPTEGTQFIVDDGIRVTRTPRLDTDPRSPHPTFAHFFFHLLSSTGFLELSRRDRVKMIRLSPKLATAAAFSHARDYERWDTVSLATFFSWIGLPPRLQTISQALQKASTFHAAEEMSAAWGLSMLESTMLGGPNDHKMWCFRSSLERSLIGPLVKRLRARGVKTRLNANASGVVLDGDRVMAVKVMADGAENPETIPCSAVISACDIPGFRHFLLHDLGHIQEVRATARLETVSNVTIRVFSRIRLPPGEPWMGIFAGPRFRLLDDYFILSRYQIDFEDWKDRGGEIIEIHSYFGSCEIDPRRVPETVIKKLIEEELFLAWPSLRGHIAHIHVHSNPRTFDKQFVGSSAYQPQMKTKIQGLFLCGSWIKTKTAIHDMEKAVTTGLEAANAVTDELGLTGFAIRSNRPHSLLQRAIQLAGPMLPEPPGVRRRQQ